MPKFQGAESFAVLRFTMMDKAYNYGRPMKEAPVNVFQDPVEIDKLLELVRNLKPKHVLEIGSLFGGTLWLWMQEMSNGGHIISVDTLVGEGDDRRMAQEIGHRHTWQRWAAERNLKFDVLETSSQDERTFETVKGIMPHIDFLFIDGNHNYDAVKRDYELFSPLVKKGIIAFHDIAFEKESQWYGVKPLWEEIKASGRVWFEFIEQPGQYGIGAICTP